MTTSDRNFLVALRIVPCEIADPADMVDWSLADTCPECEMMDRYASDLEDDLMRADALRDRLRQQGANLRLGLLVSAWVCAVAWGPVVIWWLRG